MSSSGAIGPAAVLEQSDGGAMLAAAVERLRASGVERVTFEVAGLRPRGLRRGNASRLQDRRDRPHRGHVTSPLDPGPLFPVALQRTLLAKGGSRASRPRAEIDGSGTP